MADPWHDAAIARKRLRGARAVCSATALRPQTSHFGASFLAVRQTNRFPSSQPVLPQAVENEDEWIDWIDWENL